MSLTYPWVSYPFEFFRNRTKFNGIHKSRTETGGQTRKTNNIHISTYFLSYFSPRSFILFVYMHITICGSTIYEYQRSGYRTNTRPAIDLAIYE